jgi:PAS domain S-box-containing protein
MTLQDMTRDELIAYASQLQRELSELRNVEAQLRDTERQIENSEERIRLLCEEAPFSYQSLDERGHFLAVNQAWLDTLGYGREEVIGRWFGDFLPPGYQSTFKAKFRRAEVTREIHWLDFEMFRKEGSLIPVSLDGRMEPEGLGGVKQIHCILHNISGMKISQDALKESEQRFRAVVDKVEIGISVLNADMEIVEVNEAFKRYFPHIRPGCGQICYEQYNDPPRSEPCSYCPVILTLQDGKVHEAMTETPAGAETRRYHLVSSPIKDAEGRVQYVIEMTEDLTDKKLAEDTLRRSEGRYRRLFEDAPLMYVITRDEDGVPFISDCNGLFLSSMGYTKEAVVGQPLTHFYSPESCAALLEGGGYARALAGEFVMGERQLLTSDGRLISTLLYTATEEDSAGRVIGTRAMFVDITERKSTEAALQQSEERYRAIFDNAGVGIDMVDLDGRFIQVNRALADMLGYSSEELKHLTAFDITHPEDVEMSREHLEALITGDIDSCRIQKRFIRKDGAELWADLSASAVLAPTGEHVATVGVLSDITERKRAEESLRQTERMLRTILATSPVGIVLTQERRIKWANAAWEQMFGFADEREYVDSPTSIMHTSRENYELYRERLYDNLTPGKISESYADLVRKDGSVFEADIRMNLLNASDPSKGAISTISDVSERNKTERALRESEARFRRITENMRDVVCEIDADNRFSYISPSVKRELGYDPQDLLGDSIFARIHPEDRELVMAWYAEGVRKNLVTRAEFRHRDADGRYKWFRATGSNLLDAKGKYIGAVVSSRDVTEQKLAEDMLRESEERFRAIFESTRDYVFIKDLTQAYTMVNPAFASLVDIPAPDIIGKTDREIFGPEVFQGLQEVDYRILNGETVEREETLLINGIPVTLLIVKVPLRDPVGEIFGIGGIATNITERKNIRSEERDLNIEYPSAAMRSTLNMALRAAKTDSLVLLTGESGSGKDFVAKYIHDNSRRSGGPFLSVNCAALPLELAESELFGHERGAFTGADRQKRGLLELAEGGTLLLNEIGELTLPLQAKLLTFLDTRSFMRVGGERSHTVNARLMMATNRDLAREVEEGRFRQDLYYRINVLTIRAPPLRERLEDIPVLVRQISAKLAAELQGPEIPDIDEITVEKMRRYHWPGNVRELRNEVERALILFTGMNPTPEPSDMNSIGANLGQWSPWTITAPTGESLNEMMKDFKKSLIEQALQRARGKRVEAARLLGISRDALKQHMKSLGLLGLT